MQRSVALIMERMQHEPGSEVLADGTRRSGWWITKPVEFTDDERAIRTIDAGELQAHDATFAKYYVLPEGTMLQFASGRLVGAHHIDHAKTIEASARDPERTMGDLLASGEVSRKLPIT